MHIRPAVVGAFFVLGLGLGAARAEDPYPNRTIRIIVPTTPGAITDILARVIGQALSQRWGQAVVVDNRPGADEMLGGEAVAKSPADGYTLLLTSNGGVTASPHLHGEMHYSPQRDLTPICMLGEVSPVMLVPTAVQVRSVQELVALAKDKPGQLNYGSFGNGSYSHVAMEDFKQRTGTQIMHVPYKGATPAYTALLRNEVAVMLGNLASAAGYAQGGAVQIIAAAGSHRAKARPDLPTIAESGVPGFSISAWWGVFGPANLPPALADKISAEIYRILATPELQKIYETNTMELMEKTPQQMAQFVREDVEKWGRQMRAAGIKAAD